MAHDFFSSSKVQIKKKSIGIF